MSELSDAVAAALTPEWQTTSDNLARCPMGGHLSARTFRSHVYHHLCRLVRDGRAETRTVESDQAHVYVVKEWRLRA